MTIQEIIEGLKNVTFGEGCAKFFGGETCAACNKPFDVSCQKHIATHTAKLLKEALDEQTLKDAEGVPIYVDDIVWQTEPYDGTNYEKCKVLNANYDGMVITWSDEFGLAYQSPKNITHNEPDSWEKLESDATKGIEDYWNCYGKNCWHCEQEPRIKYDVDTCREAQTLDVLRRAKALADKQK